MRWCRLPRDLASVEILNSTSWNRLNIFQISSFRLSFPNSEYRSQRRERDILWLDKPWSVRIVSIACHPSIHLSILETLYTTCPFQELILSSESTYYPSPSPPMWWDCRMCGVFAISGEAWYTTCELERVLWSATASFLYSSPSKASDICSFWHKSRQD